MKRIFAACTILLYVFLSAIDNFSILDALASATGSSRATINLFLSVAGSGAFLWFGELKDRIAAPIPGLLTAGVFLYAGTLIIGDVFFILLAKTFGTTAQNPWSALIPAVITGTFATPVLVISEVLLVAGVVRLLTQLSAVPSDNAH